MKKLPGGRNLAGSGDFRRMVIGRESNFPVRLAKIVFDSDFFAGTGFSAS
jgi:hypothetical protein